MVDRSPLPSTVDHELATYHDAMREWQHAMAVHFDGMPSPDEMATYMTWRPSPTPPVRGRQGSFFAASTTPGALTPRMGDSTPLDGETPRDNPRPMFVEQHAHRRHLSTTSTAGTPLPTLPPSRPLINAGPSTSRPWIDVAGHRPLGLAHPPCRAHRLAVRVREHESGQI
jgi:hypothetical protein